MIDKVTRARDWKVAGFLGLLLAFSLLGCGADSPSVVDLMAIRFASKISIVQHSLNEVETLSDAKDVRAQIEEAANDLEAYKMEIDEEYSRDERLVVLTTVQGDFRQLQSKFQELSNIDGVEEELGSAVSRVLEVLLRL